MIGFMFGMHFAFGLSFLMYLIATDATRGMEAWRRIGLAISAVFFWPVFIMIGAWKSLDAPEETE